MPLFAASSWTQANWTTPAVPSGATGLSFGLNLAAAGSLTTDDYALSDEGTAPPPARPKQHRNATVTGGSIGSLSDGYAANQADDLDTAC